MNKTLKYRYTKDGRKVITEGVIYIPSENTKHMVKNGYILCDWRLNRKAWSSDNIPQTAAECPICFNFKQLKLW